MSSNEQYAKMKAEQYNQANVGYQAASLGHGRNEGGSYPEPIRAEAVVSVEMKNLEETIMQVHQAAQDFVNRVAPVLFFGPETGCKAGESDCPPGSDMARTLYQLRHKLLDTVVFLRNCETKVNL